MQVWELMAELSQARANTNVMIGLHGTLNSEQLYVHISQDGAEVTITGGDVQLIDDNGNECGLLSELSAVDEDD